MESCGRCIKVWDRMKKAITIFLLAAVGVAFGSPVRSASGGRHAQYLVKGQESQYTVQDYVQTGLVSIWDGIENVGLGEHDSETATWVDLTGNGYDLTITPATTAFDDISFVYDPSDKHVASIGNGGFPFSFTGNFTFDFCATMYQSSPCRWFGWGLSNGNNNYVSFGVTSYSAQRYNRWKSVSPTTGYHFSVILLPEAVVATTSLTYDGSIFRFYTDGQQKDTRTASWSITVGQIFSIGGNEEGPSGGKQLGRCHCLRVYNRTLTHAELEWNSKVDQARFGK